MRWRLGLAPLMALIAVLALGLAAMKVASEAAAQAFVLTSIATLLVAIVGAWIRHDRAAFAGFALFGVAYLLILATPVFVHPLAPNPDRMYLIRLRLDGPATALGKWLHPEFPPPPEPFPLMFDQTSGRWARNGLFGASPFTPQEEQAYATYQGRKANAENQLRAQFCATWIALAIQGIAFASLGAFVGQYLARTDSRPVEPDAPRPPAEDHR